MEQDMYVVSSYLLALVTSVIYITAVHSNLVNSLILIHVFDNSIQKCNEL